MSAENHPPPSRLWRNCMLNLSSRRLRSRKVVPKVPLNNNEPEQMPFVA